MPKNLSFRTITDVMEKRHFVSKDGIQVALQAFIVVYRKTGQLIFWPSGYPEAHVISPLFLQSSSGAM